MPVTWGPPPKSASQAFVEAFMESWKRAEELSRERKKEERERVAAEAKEKREVAGEARAEAKEKRTVQESVAKGLLPPESLLPYTPQRLEPYGTQIPPQTPITPIPTPTVPPGLGMTIPQEPWARATLPGGQVFTGAQRQIQQQPEVARQKATEMQKAYQAVQAAIKPNVFSMFPFLGGGLGGAIPGAKPSAEDRYDELKKLGYSDDKIYDQLALEGYR